MHWKTKLLQQLLSEEFRNGCDIGASALIALEWRFIRTIKDEERVYRQRDEAEKAIVESSQRWICAA